jgi:uncharacterized membrane protein/predicted DsbA family dithiol-disulfide isomerase
MILAALLTSIASVGTHLYLTLHYYQVTLGLQEGPSACHLNASFNCDAVAVSSFSNFAGIPVAIWGAWTNLIVALLIVLSLINLLANRERVLRYSGGLALLVALVSVVMGFISSYMLKTYCLYCMGAYALSFATLAFLWKGTHFLDKKTFGQDLNDLFKTHRWVLGLLLVIPAGSVLTNSVIAQNYGLDKIQMFTNESLQNWALASSMDFKLEGQGLSYQKADIPPVMTIVEFADFLCPHCRMAYMTLHSFAESRDDVRLIFKTFPLDGTCNKAIEHKGDGTRCLLAASVFCAEKINKKGWALHHWIFDHQELFARSGTAEKNLKDAAEELGLSFEDIKSCAAANDIGDLIERQADEGAAAKIQGTPSIFVNGRSLERGQILPVLEAVYQKLKASSN